MDASLILCAVLFLTFCYWKLVQSAKLPPGPTGIPILGYIPFVTKTPYIKFNTLKDKYGDILSLYVGQRLFVVLSSYDIVKEVFIKQGNNFSGRPNMATTTPPEFLESRGIIFNEGSSWLENKQESMNILKVFFRDKALGETVIVNEIEHFLQEIRKFHGEAKDISKLIHYSMTNISLAFTTGNRIDFDDQQLKSVLRYMREYIDAIQVSGCEMAFPTIFKIPFVQKIFATAVGMNSYRQLRKYFDDEINKVDAALQHNTANFSMISEWLQTHPKENPKYDYHKNRLTAVLIDFMLAGSDTVAAFLQWAVLFMAEYPTVQQRIQKEIDEVIGKTNIPTMANQTKMPYTEAAIMEIHRIITVVPMGIPRMNNETAEVRDYVIPKDSLVVANLWAIHHDPKIFRNPEKFCPDRFLENGHSKKVAELMPFSAGKRQCVGEAMGRLEIFLFLVLMLQRFSFEIPAGVKLTFDVNFKNVTHPLPQKICAFVRE